MAVAVIVVVLRMWKLFSKPIKSQDSRPLGYYEMQAVWGNSETDGQMSNAFHIISKKPLTFATVKKAATLVADSQPLMSACIRPKSGNKNDLWFLPMDNVDYDIQVNNHGDWTREVERQMSIQYKESHGPLWRLIFFPNVKIQKAEGLFQHESVIVLACHHAIMDGVSLMRLIAQIMSVINKLQNGADNPNLPTSMLYAPLELATDFRGFKENVIWRVTQVCLFLLRVLPRWLVVDRLSIVFSGPNPFYEQCKIEMKRNPSLAVGTSILPLELSREETKALLLACRQNGATIQGAAMAATNVAMDKILLTGKSNTKIDLQTMIMANARSFLSIKLPDHAMGNYPFPMLMPIKVRKNHQACFWPSAVSCSEAVHKKVNRVAFVGSVNVSYFVCHLMKDTLLSDESKEPNVGPLVNVFSNLGNCKYVNEEDANVKAVARHGAVAGNIRSLAPFKHYITTVDGRLCWTLVYSRRYVSTEMAERVGNYIVTSLLQASAL